MKLIHRIGYYLGGFSIGLVILAFFLSGKKTSCDYGPNARTIKNISLKKKMYSKEAVLMMKTHHIDTVAVNDIIRFGNVNFSESNTEAKDCNIYVIENIYNDKDIVIDVKNCESIATILSINLPD